MDIATLFLLMTIRFGLPPDLLSSVCFVETRHHAEAIHRDDGQGNSIGICQIKLKSAQTVGYKGSEEDLLKPEVNIYYAAAILKHQIDRYNGDVKKGVIAYNIGHAGLLTTTKYQAKVF